MLKSIKWEIWYLLIGIFYESINSIYMICFIDSQIFTIFVTQCSITVFSGRIKRESGVNPGQSRCCKLHNIPDWSPLFFYLTGRLRIWKWVRRPALHTISKASRKGYWNIWTIISLLQIPCCFLNCALCKFLIICHNN